MNFCECGHQPSDHYCESGACEALVDEDERFCNCPRYQWQGDQ